ncbi:MAG: glycosyltransferase family 39 protein [Chloroflexota bacterium]|nr:glycosyltransferase family 39 protein [Chloroflexota bacterium]
MKSSLTALGPYLVQGAQIIVGMFLAVAILIFSIHAVMGLGYPYPLDYGEAPLVDQAMRLAGGENIYQADLSTPPYTIANYPPLYVLAMTPFIKLCGPSFLPGRAIAVFSTLATALFLGLIIHTHTKNRQAAWLSGILFLTFRYVVGWSALARVDMLGLACSSAALYVVSRYHADRRGLWLTALLLLAAIYTRQTYGLAAPLASFVWLWATEGWKKALTLAALVGGAGLFLLLALNGLTQGGFILNIITANVNTFESATLWRYAQELATRAPLLLAGGLLLLCVPRRVSAWPLVAPYLIGSLISAATVGKIGSNVNYLVELSAALSLVTGALVAWSAAGATRGRWWQAPLHAVLLILVSMQAGGLLQQTLEHPVTELKWRVKAEKNQRELYQLVSEHPGPVLADEYMGFLTLQDRPLYIQPFEMTQLANAGRWDQSALLADIHAGKFPLIMIHHFPHAEVYKTRWTPEMLEAIQHDYTLTHSRADTLVYQPRSAVINRLPAEGRCPSAPWRLPTRSDRGMWWFSRGLGFMATGEPGTVPVYAVAEGWLTRRSYWNDTVAIQHIDPLHPGEKIWTVYQGMSDRQDEESFISSSFPPGSVDVPVEAGELLGYQGRWQAQNIWAYLFFVITPAREDGSFPAALVDLANETDTPLPRELEDQGWLDPAPYLKLLHSQVMGQNVWLPWQCQTEE